MSTTPSAEAGVPVLSRPSFLQKLVSDTRACFDYNGTWRALAWADIRSKYRRTALGPWWITVTQACMATMMALISGRFLGAEMAAYLPHFMVSITIWNFISSSLTESSQMLIYSGGIIKCTNMPIIVHIMRLIQRNFIILLHNAAVIPLVWLVYRWTPDESFPLVIPGMIICYVFAAASATIISFACVRYRDIPPLVTALMQLLFFVSPIIWMPDTVRGGHVALLLNPMNYILGVVRDPLLGRPVDPGIWIGAILVTLVVVALAAVVNARYRARVVFWV